LALRPAFPQAAQGGDQCPVDADVLDWLRGKHERYQTEINRILREKMVAEQTEGGGA